VVQGSRWQHAVAVAARLSHLAIEYFVIGKLKSFLSPLIPAASFSDSFFC
jgi:hypothetical protein